MKNHLCRLLLYLICLNPLYAQEPLTAQDSLFRSIKMDSTMMKNMVRYTCECFKPLQDINVPSYINFEEPQRDTRLQDSIQQAGKVLLDKLGGCVSERLREHKDKFGMAKVPDSLFNFAMYMKQPPPVLFQTISPNIALYAMRDCSYLFNFCVRAVDLQQQVAQRRREKMDSLERVRLADTTSKNMLPPLLSNDEYRERPYFKRVKATLKRIEAKGLPYLVVEREDAEGKKYEEKYLILDKLYDEEEEKDVIKNFKQNKGKKVKLSARKQEIYNAKTNQYEQVWRVSEITFLDK